MLIEIREDIIAKAEADNDDALNLLRLLAMANRQGKHIATSNRELIKRISKINGLDRQSKAIFHFLIDNDYILGSGLTKKIEFKTILSYSVRTCRDHSNNCVWLNPSEYDLFNYLDATRILCENLSDCEFYEYFISYYKREAKLSKASHNLSKMMGGGNTIEKVYEEASKTKEYFCIAITDSDKYYPTSDIGDTPKGVKDKDAEYKSFNTYHYILKNVSEVENLIPKNVINVLRYKEKYPDYDTSYLDFKYGLFCSPLHKFAEKYDYWVEILGEEKLKLAKQCTLPEAQCGKSCSCKQYYSPVYGADILDLILEDPHSKKELKNPQLVYSQINEWKAIGKLLFEWGCSVRRKNV